MSEILLAGIWGYLVGAIPTGVIVAQAMRGVDVRTTGSGHTGGTNVARVAGLWGGALTALGDILLGVLAVALARMLLPHPWAGTVAGVAAVVGHDWSVFIRFAGGIGLAHLAGTMLGFDCLRALAGGGTFIVLWLILTKVLHCHRARATIFGILVFAPVLWMVGTSPPGIVLGALGAAAVIIKTLPDWNRDYSAPAARVG